MRISDWSSDVCSSDLTGDHDAGGTIAEPSRGNHMRKSILGLSAVALAALSAPAFAQDEPTPELTVTGNAAVVTDYRFRGLSQTDKRFALQGGITVTHASGFYVSTWGSSIDDYVAAGSDQELDLIAGYSKTVGAATFDVGVLYYYYPSSGGGNTDFVEPYASVKGRSEEHTSELQSLMRISYAVFCLKKKKEN